MSVPIMHHRMRHDLYRPTCTGSLHLDRRIWHLGLKMVNSAEILRNGLLIFEGIFFYTSFVYRLSCLLYAFYKCMYILCYSMPVHVQFSSPKIADFFMILFNFL